MTWSSLEAQVHVRFCFVQPLDLQDGCELPCIQRFPPCRINCEPGGLAQDRFRKRNLL
ncbi:MAG: hypothetical protein R6V12_16120 [Candidatus Hydrogenedentota bacterium]